MTTNGRPSANDDNAVFVVDTISCCDDNSQHRLQVDARNFVNFSLCFSFFAQDQSTEQNKIVFKITQLVAHFSGLLSQNKLISVYLSNQAHLGLSLIRAREKKNECVK